MTILKTHHARILIRLRTGQINVSFFHLNFFVSSGDHIVPNFEEIWPSDKNKDDKYKRRLIGMEYYMDVSTSIYRH